MADSILEGIVEHIKKCPLLKDGVFRVDAMGDQAVEYAVETGIFDPVVQRYVNGDELRQYQFNFGICGVGWSSELTFSDGTGWP